MARGKLGMLRNAAILQNVREFIVSFKKAGVSLPGAIDLNIIIIIIITFLILLSEWHICFYQAHKYSVFTNEWCSFKS